MGYSVLVFILLLIYVVFIAINRITIVRSLEGKFEESVIAYLFLVNILPVFIIPMIWAETGRFTEVLNAWTDFEIIYYKVAGKMLPLNLKYTGMLVAICLPLLSSLSVVVTHLTMVDFKVSQVIPYCILDNLTYMMGGYWYMSCQTISHSAGILADDFQTALQHIGPAAMIADYRALWLRLSKLTRDTGTATCITFTFINLYLFFQITLSIYGLLSQISEGFGIKDIGLFVTAASNICLLFVICDEAHSASQAVRTNFQKKLLMVELSWMNTDAQIEINMFLRATEMNPSAINCGGYFDVNRNLFKSVSLWTSIRKCSKFRGLQLLTTMVTYLVVLLQFQISIPDDTAAIQGMLNSSVVAASNTNALRN
ncbi:hypothetical protein HA402_012376 [Bradysia odoriphaga]|nr:hypothetical protein HA402_012376 [Bradysia odoriphaga]